jgi:hypothetical protein
VPAGSTPGTKRLLLIDDAFNSLTNPASTRIDTMWSNAVVRNMPGGAFSTLRLQLTNPFRSTADVRQTFLLYDAVIWYRGTDTAFPPPGTPVRPFTTLKNALDGIGDAIREGTSFAVEGLDLIDGVDNDRVPPTGPFTESFAAEFFGSDFFFKNYQSGYADSSVGWGVASNAVLRSATDSLRFAIAYQGLRAFTVHDTNHVFLWAREGVLSQGNPLDMPVAISYPYSPQAQVIAITFPVYGTSASTSSFPQRASVLLNKVVQGVLNP